MVNIMNSYIADELAHKVKVLSESLHKSDSIVRSLETENSILKDILTSLMSINKEDLVSQIEVDNDRHCAI